MGQILRNWRIPAAAVFSVLIIAGAYLLARSVESPSTAEASAETALLQAIAMRDSDGDGLPDWEETLYGTSPNTTDTFNLGMTDGEAVAKGLIVPKAIADIAVATSSPLSLGLDGLPPPPAEGTLTATFAQNFFTLYLSAKQVSGGAALSESDVANIAGEALSSLSSTITIAPDYKSAKDLTVFGSGPEALKAFAASAEAVLIKNKSDATSNELLYLKDVVENNDNTALPLLVSKAKAYRDAAVGLSMLTVPQELATSYLAFINALMRVSGIVGDFARVNDDPLAAMLALQQYVPATQVIGQALIDIGATYTAGGIVLSTDAPGASFVNGIADITTLQKAAIKNP